MTDEIPEMRLGFKGETQCCESSQRTHSITVSGMYVYGLHEHKGLLRGMTPTPSGEQVRFWHLDGRICANTASEVDLVL